MARQKPAYSTIDERVAKEIARLHKRYPKLGHHGLLQALHECDIQVEPPELKQFLKEHGFRAERSWRPWRWRGLPSWLGGPPESLK